MSIIVAFGLLMVAAAMIGLVMWALVLAILTWVDIAEDRERRRAQAKRAGFPWAG